MTDPKKPDDTPDGEPESLEISKEGTARLLEMWQPIIEAVVDVCAGVRDAEDELEAFYAKLATREDWRLLPDIFRRITAGERDGDALTEGLDVVDTIIVRGTLAALENPNPALIQPEPEACDPIDGFLDMVERALGPDAPDGLRERLIEAADDMALPEEDEEEDPQVIAFGCAVGALLRGEAPDPEGLVPAHAERLTALYEGEKP